MCRLRKWPLADEDLWIFLDPQTRELPVDAFTLVIPAKTSERIKRNSIRQSSTGAYTADMDWLRIKDYVTAAHADEDPLSKFVGGCGLEIPGSAHLWYARIRPMTVIGHQPLCSASSAATIARNRVGVSMSSGWWNRIRNGTPSSVNSYKATTWIEFLENLFSCISN